MCFNANEFLDVLETLWKVGILQSFKRCDDKRLTGKLVLEIDYNQGGIRSVLKSEQEKLK